MLTSAFSSRQTHQTANDLKFLAPNSDDGLAPDTPGELVRRALGAVVRRAGLYALLTAAALALQCAWYFFLHPALALEEAFELPVLAFFTMIAYIITAMELRAQSAPPGEIFSWAFGRLWAVVVIDFFLWFSIGIGAVMLLRPENFVLGAVLLFLAAPLIFSDVAASIEAVEPWYAVLPLAVRRSIVLSYSRGNIMRALFLMGMQVTAVFITLLLESYLTARHAPAAAFWASQPLTTALTPFFGALTTMMYFDCAAREREAKP